MAGHLQILFIFITFTVGSACLMLALVHYFKYRNRMVKHYLFFFSVFTLMIMTHLINQYGETNLDHFNQTFEHINSYFNEFIAFYGLMFTIPYFIHMTLVVPGKHHKNRILSTIVLSAFLIQHLTETVSHGWLDQAGDLFEDVLFVGIAYYSVCIGLYYYRKTDNALNRHFALPMLLVLIFFMPALVLDTVYDPIEPFDFFPLIYVVMSLVYTFLMIRLEMKNTSHHAIMPDPHWISQFHLTAREQEIVALILQGKSNREIEERLFIAKSTVKTHIQNSYAKLGIKNRYELMARVRANQTSEHKVIQ